MIIATVALSIALGLPTVDVNPDSLEPRVLVKHKIKSGGTPWHRPQPKTVTSTSGLSIPKVNRCLIRDSVAAITCIGGGSRPTPTPAPAVDLEGAILSAARSLPLPRLQIQTEPADETLVNIETNLFTEPQTFNRTLNLLGANVQLTARPVNYTWHPGDGSTFTTPRPGGRYPDLDVTHRYRSPADAVSPRVDVTYRIRYRVDGGAWTTLDETITAPGPANSLRVAEARPVITGD